MRFAVYILTGRRGLAVDLGEGFRGLFRDEPGYPGDLNHLVANQAELSATANALVLGQPISIDAVQLLPPFPNPGKIICIGLNYVDHSGEVGITLPNSPTVFGRFASSLIGHGAPIAMPRQSPQLDYEGELVAVIGRGGKNISREEALNHVAGYSIFNDVSVRDYQLRTTQWTMGKNFDGTGAFGPFFVVSEALPPGCKGLQLTTRLNGRIVQNANMRTVVESGPTCWVGRQCWGMSRRSNNAPRPTAVAMSEMDSTTTGLRFRSRINRSSAAGALGWDCRLLCWPELARRYALWPPRAYSTGGS
jgi:acylpyruvate hydrolase